MTNAVWTLAAYAIQLGALVAQRVVDLALGGLTARPDRLHDFELLGGEGAGLAAHLLMI